MKEKQYPSLAQPPGVHDLKSQQNVTKLARALSPMQQIRLYQG
jgi:hypothetical protein